MQNNIRREAPCSVCGIDRFSVDQLGFKFCIYGHQVEGFQEEGLDFDQLGAMKKIYVNKGKRKQQANDFYYGENYKFLQLQLFQYVLHLQCQYLIKNHEFPTEFEDSVKELFLLYINWNDELFIEVDRLGHPVPKKLFVQVKDQTEKDLEDLNLSDSNNETEGSDNENNKNKGNQGNNLKFKGKRHLHMLPLFKGENPSKVSEITLPWTLSFLYLGAIALNIDVLLLDLQQLALNNQLPYRSIVSQIPESYWNRYKFPNLMTGIIPTVDKLEHITNYLSTIMLTHYKIKFPPLNVPLILYRLCNHFELPPIYFNSFYFIYIKLKISTAYDNGYMGKNSPLCKIYALFIIILKLVFGFDGHLRSQDPLFKLESNNCDEILKKFETLNKSYYDNLKPKNLSEYIERYQINSTKTVNKLKESFENDKYQNFEPGNHKKTMIDGTPNNVIMKLLELTKENNQPSDDNDNNPTTSNLPPLFDTNTPNSGELVEPGLVYPIFGTGISKFEDLPAYYLRLLSCISEYSQLSFERLSIGVKRVEKDLFELEN